MISEYAESNCKNGVTMRGCVLLLGLVVLMGVGGWNGVFGQDWSDEIRLTHAQDDYQFANNSPHFAIDSDGNLHFVFTAYNYGDDDRTHVIYQKFNRIGEALTEQLVISELAEIPDTIECGPYVLDIFLSENNLIHIFIRAWGDGPRYDLQYYIKYDTENDSVYRCVELDGFDNIDIEREANIVADSRDQIIISGSAGSYWEEGDRENDNFQTHIFYRR